MTPTHDTCKWCSHEYELKESNADDRYWFCSKDCEVEYQLDRREWTDS